MKLFASFSEAIREGAKLRPQAFGATFRDGKTCAYGAAAEAMGLDVSGCVDEIDDVYPYTAVVSPEPFACPAKCGDTWSVLGNVVVHLNDDHKWTREAIADWLETEEEKLGYVTLTINEPVELAFATVETRVCGEEPASL